MTTDERIILVEARFEDRNEVFEIFQNSTFYFKKIDGQAPTQQTVQYEMKGRPEEPGPNYIKSFFFLTFLGRKIGVADLHIHHPDNGTATFGAILLREDHHAKGLGRQAYEVIEEYLQQVHRIRRIELGVSDRNDVGGFWTKMGFTNTGETKEWQGETVLNVLTKYQKTLD
jgi:RimJ/RimL family protein N-acetyltransferase